MLLSAQVHWGVSASWCPRSWPGPPSRAGLGLGCPGTGPCPEAELAAAVPLGHSTAAGGKEQQLMAWAANRLQTTRLHPKIMLRWPQKPSESPMQSGGEDPGLMGSHQLRDEPHTKLQLSSHPVLEVMPQSRAGVGWSRGWMPSKQSYCQTTGAIVPRR